MKLQTRAREAPELNLTSLIDVVLLLLVFFMVSTSFVREAEINLRLPEADVDEQMRPSDDQLEIVITETGNFIVNGRPLVNNDRTTLRNAIRQLIGNNRDLPVAVRADARSMHQSFVTAVEVLGQLGFAEVNIAAVTPPDA
jgi:biopolymer transport protein ExbD